SPMRALPLPRCGPHRRPALAGYSDDSMTRPGTPPSAPPRRCRLRLASEVADSERRITRIETGWQIEVQPARADSIVDVEDRALQSDPLMRRLSIAVAVALLAIRWTSAPPAASDVYQIDPAQSRATIAVGKGGAFSFLAGHTHEVSGPIESGSLPLLPAHPSP